jgi:hypothetical protein
MIKTLQDIGLCLFKNEFIRPQTLSRHNTASVYAASVHAASVQAASVQAASVHAVFVHAAPVLRCLAVSCALFLGESFEL